ncbi:MAG TPA: hypothetical protein VE173_07015 [Longimicrobiales bacterium]|jgi:hypothetical protein|nr:hypothetical protein [Longimicrobiales bacterium]
MESNRAWKEGAVAGVLAYVAVAGFFALLNLTLGRSPFATAFLMGKALGAGAPGPSAEIGVVLAANGLHLLVSLAVGIAAAFLIFEVEHHHGLWYAVLLAFLGGFFLSIVVVGTLGAEIASVATWPQIAVANTIGALVMGAYLGRMHRSLLGDIRRELEA